MPIIRIDQLQQFTAINVLSDPGDLGGPVIVPSCAQISLVWTQENGRPAHNVLYGRYSGPFAGTVTQANAILTALTTGGSWTALAAFLTAGVGLAAVTIRNVSVRDQALITSTGGGAPGTSVAASLPNEVAICVTLRTAKAGARYRGRMYVPDFATNALGAGNVIAAGAVTAVNNWAATITGALNSQGYVFVLGLKARGAYTGSTGTEHAARPAESEVITQASTRDNHWDSQRRRGLK